jgi:hypothetical protein
MAKETFPRDRFDTIPAGIERVGAHRAPQKPGRGWSGFVWAAGATVLLVTAGIIGVMLFNDRLLFGDSAPPPTPDPVVTAEPTVDPAARITVLNGTTTTGLAAGAGEMLTAAGFTVGTATNAGSDDIEMTAVYFADPALEGAARGVAQAVGGAEVRLSDDVTAEGSTLILVLGADYVERVAP